MGFCPILIYYMKSFEVEEAKNGAKLITRNGRHARIICYDRLTAGRPGHIIALVKGRGGIFENIVYYNNNGQQIDHIRDLDLMIEDEQEEQQQEQCN